jgi:hypothetical protein
VMRSPRVCITRRCGPRANTTSAPAWPGGPRCIRRSRPPPRSQSSCRLGRECLRDDAESCRSRCADGGHGVDRLGR